MLGAPSTAATDRDTSVAIASASSAGATGATGETGLRYVHRMDLSERSTGNLSRHPWEIARSRALGALVRRAGGPLGRVLDFGCGDGYAGLFLLEQLQGVSYLGYDTQLTDDQCLAWSSADGRITYVNREPPPVETFETVLACDVIEHVVDDVGLLRAAWSRVRLNGRLLVTVPAFQALFSDHDRALRHHRRYSLPQLSEALARAGLPVRTSGYLFGTLLIPRLMSAVAERLRHRWTGGTAHPARQETRNDARSDARNDAQQLGIGNWKMPAPASSLVAGLLGIENDALLALAFRGLKLPGLSAWALSVRTEAS